MLSQFGLKPSDVQYVVINGGPPKILALKSGSVSAAMLNPPDNFVANRDGIKTLIDISTFELETASSCISSTRSYIKAYPDLARRFLSAVAEGIQVVKTQAKASFLALRKYQPGLDHDVGMKLQEFMADRYLNPPVPTIQGILRVMDEISVDIPEIKSVDPAKFLDLRLVKALQDSGFLNELKKNY